MVNMERGKATVITSGNKYLDIDAYASMIAYRELLKSTGTHCYAVSTADTNESVPQFLLDFSYRLDKYEVSAEDDYIVVDVSNPDFIDTFVNPEKIIQLIDHHTGFEDFWQARLGEKAEIENIGAVCTIIFEKIESANHLKLLDTELCQLLAAGILDNTLNLQSSNTSTRDRRAYAKLCQIGEIQQDFSEQYFDACFTKIQQNLSQTIREGLKIERVHNSLPEVFGQLIVPDHIYLSYQDTKQEVAAYDKWIFNLISLADGKSYIYCSGDEVANILVTVLPEAKMWSEHCVVLEKFMLRKEIMKYFKESRTKEMR